MSYYIKQSSPVPSPSSLEIVDVDGAINCYYTGPFASRAEAVDYKDEAIARALQDWNEDETGSPFWAVTPNGERCPPPEWAKGYGWEFYDPYPEGDGSHYLAVRPRR